MDPKTVKWLSAIFIVTIVVRLILAFFHPGFTYESYFHLRQVEYITENGLPLYNDPFSYGGRENIFLPFFHYFITFFNLFLPLELTAKIIPNILIASLTLIIFFISRKITENDTSSIMAAMVGGFLPILFETNSFTPSTLFLPLIFLTIYTYLNLNKKNYLYFYIFFFLILSLTSSATFLLLIGFGIYLLLSFIENKKVEPAEKELIIFSFFFYLWIQLLFFKNILLKEGLEFIWQNIPTSLIKNYFPTITIAEALILVGVVPFLLGIYVTYRSLFHLQNNKAFLLISLVISTTALTWVNIIPFSLSLSFFAIILSILFAIFYSDLTTFIQKTKIAKYKKYVSIIIFCLLIPSIIYPAITSALSQEGPSTEEIKAFQWLKENSHPNQGTLALLEEGHLITYFNKHRNVMDDQFALIKDVEQRLTNINSLYTTNFQTFALDIADQYKLDYLIMTPKAKIKYQKEDLSYTNNNCFQKIYDMEVEIYKIRCALKVTT